METNNSNLGYEIKPLHWLKLGDTFRLKVNGPVYIREHYVISSKKYRCSCDNAMKCRYFSREKLVIVY